ncbi:lipase family protein [Brevundimonas variabilis]|uniref:Acetyl esterase/lipase n=1 Tax=Brevundimonas variabilis TaxID=74312 RepID=A0A7W9FD45_9CAUL|nr:lipase family protein [Brevundimonas variabilis]MBB5744865.1 acetyl esterase/lipase [Brevundimonas variabilis]
MRHLAKVLLSVVLLGLPVGAGAQEAGRLISADPVAQAPDGVQAWRVRYWTRDDRLGMREVSGMVLAPSGTPSRQPRPVIAWTHGTWGTATQCAPSQSAKFFEATPAVDAVRDGYVVVAPDYPGLGNPGAHPYLVGVTTARSVLDGVRAARALPGASAGPRFAVWGESQGGHAALWTGQLAGAEGSDLQLLGVAAAAPPTDLAANFRQAGDPSARAFLTALAADSWSRYYDIPLVIGRRTTPRIMRRLANTCVSVDSTPRLGALVGIIALRRDLRSFDFAATPPWADVVAANSTSPVSSVPVLIAQTRDDPLVAPAVTRTFAQRLCANRVWVRWIDLPGGDHATTGRQSAAPTLEWISGLFAGTPASNDCATI